MKVLENTRTAELYAALAIVSPSGSVYGILMTSFRIKYSIARAKSLSVTRGSTTHIADKSFIQNGRAISPVASMENCTDDLDQEYSTSSIYVPVFHIVASNGKFEGNSEVS